MKSRVCPVDGRPPLEGWANQQVLVMDTSCRYATGNHGTHDELQAATAGEKPAEAGTPATAAQRKKWLSD